MPCATPQPAAGWTWACARTDGDLLVEFTDTGPGIPPELLERVFERFYRVLGTGTQGSGLGLAIARIAAGRGGMHIELLNRGDRSGPRSPDTFHAKSHLSLAC